VKQGIVQSLYNRALVNCQDRKDFVTEIQNVNHDLWKNGYPKHFVDITMNKFGKTNYPSTQSNEVCTVVIPYVKGIQTSLNVLGINITLRPFLKQNTPYVIYLCELNRIPSLNNR
jgi:hypothetical protein